MVLIHYSGAEFLQLGLRLIGFSGQRLERTVENTKLGRFRSAFAIWPDVCSKIFDDFQTTDIADARIDSPSERYYLIALNWLATYKKEGEMAGFFDLDEKTVRLQIRKYVSAIRAFKADKIIWNDLDTVPELIPLTVDGIHCRVPEQHRNPDARWKSFKNGKPGVSYELAISIHESKLVWINGPFKAGTRDIDMFNAPAGLGSKIPAGKKVLVDQGYPGVPDKVVQKVRDVDSPEVYDFKNRALARHETFNGRLKNYQVLFDMFRHRGPNSQFMPFHKTVFEACCVLVQYECDNGHPLFQV